MKEKIKNFFNKSHLKRNASFFFIALFLIIWTILIFNYGAESIINFLGVKNGYIIIALISLFSGLSTLGSPLYITTLLTFVVGGLDPILISFTSGTFLFLGDSFFFLLGRKGRYALLPFFEKNLNKFSNFIKNKPRWLVMFLIYLYYSFAPLPNDIVSIPLGLSNLEYKKFALPSFLGTITFLLLITHGVALIA